MPQQIIFVRHGETTHNKEKKLMNWIHDVGTLSELGKHEASLVGNKLQQYHIDAMYASDLRRTKETADIIAKHLGITPIFTKYLRERDLGDFGDLTMDEIGSKWPDKLAKFLDHSDIDWHDHGGESLRDVHNRFIEFLSTLETKHSKENILFVTHSGFLYTTIRDVFGLLPKNSWLDVAHTSVTILEKSGDQYLLKSFNKID